MNRPVTVMWTTSGKPNVRQVVLSPFVLWTGLVAIVVVFGLGVWGAAHVYRVYTESKSYRANYAQLQEQYARVSADFEALNARLQELEALESDVRHVLGISEEPEGEPVPHRGQGGSGPEVWLDETSSATDITGVTESNDDVESIPIAEDSVGRAERLLQGLAEIRKITMAELEDIATTPTIVPIQEGHQYWISSAFGMRTSPFTGRREFHGGIDISAREGTPVIAPADGVVVALVQSKRPGPLGHFIKIKHNDTYMTVYGHLRRKQPFAEGLKVGSRVKRLDVIGYVGSTGRSTGAHVHYEVRKNGERVNPFNYLLDR